MVQNKGKKMGAKKNDRLVTLACGDCKNRNYSTTKNKKNNAARMELNKFCPTCNGHKLHKETK